MDHTFEGFKGQFPELEKAANFSLKETNDSLTSLKKIVDQMGQLLKNLSSEDKFKQKSNENYDNFKMKVESFEKKNKKNIYLVFRVIDYSNNIILI